MKYIYLYICLLLIVSPDICFSQPEKLFVPIDILRSYERGSRTWNGEPGEIYFQNKADYTIDALFDPQSLVLRGKAGILYSNHSPITLRNLVIRLYQNANVKGGVRGRPIHPDDAGDPVLIHSISVDGKALDLNNPGTIVHKSQTNIVLSANIPAGTDSRIEIEWECKLPAFTTQRYGPVSPDSYFVAYWYPQIAVFDDINGWDLNDYAHLAEIYNNFGNYRVSLSLPASYKVWATGELRNPEEVLDSLSLSRLREAQNSSIVVLVNDPGTAGIPESAPEKLNTWIFEAMNVSDFAFGVSKSHIWEACTVSLDNGHKVLIQSVYLPESVHFREVCKIAAIAVKEFSDSLIGFPYPFPVMTVFNGNAGMEFPMIVNDREMASTDETWFLTVHEIGHSWLPFITGTNQSRHGFMDEGMVTMLGCELQASRTPDFNLRKMYLQYYPEVAGRQEDIPLMVNSAFISDHVFQVHEYMRPSLAFWTFRDIVGVDTFKACLLEFIEQWKWKHPTPYDFFNTVKKVTGEDYGWFWNPWFLEFAYPDLEITGLEKKMGRYSVKITNQGGMPFPSVIEVHTAGGMVEKYPLNADIWKDKDEFLLRLKGNKKPVKLVLNTETYPDVQKSNNHWPRK